MDKNSVNERKPFPSVYKTLLNPQGKKYLLNFVLAYYTRTAYISYSDEDYAVAVENSVFF